MADIHDSAVITEKEQTFVVKNVDMSEEMQNTVKQVAFEARKSSKVEKDIAASIKREFDNRFGTTWHCIVGRSFGSFVTHESKNFIYFYVDNLAILLFKTL